MQIPSAVESPRFTDNFSLELVVIYSGSWFNEQRWRWPPRADNDTIFDQFTAGLPNVIFNSSNREINNLECAKCTVQTYLVSQRRLFSLFIQSSLRPQKLYEPVPISRNKSPVWK